MITLIEDIIKFLIIITLIPLALATIVVLFILSPLVILGTIFISALGLIPDEYTTTYKEL